MAAEGDGGRESHTRTRRVARNRTPRKTRSIIFFIYLRKNNPKEKKKK
jgi:hypothetical protein